MTASLTRQDVEREVRAWAGRYRVYDFAPATDQILAALLAMAECPFVSSLGETHIRLHPKCVLCAGTGLHQAALARGLAKLKGEGT